MPSNIAWADTVRLAVTQLPDDLQWRVQAGAAQTLPATICRRCGNCEFSVASPATVTCIACDTVSGADTVNCFNSGYLDLGRPRTKLRIQVRPLESAPSYCTGLVTVTGWASEQHAGHAGRAPQDTPRGSRLRRSRRPAPIVEVHGSTVWKSAGYPGGAYLSLIARDAMLGEIGCAQDWGLVWRYPDGRAVFEADRDKPFRVCPDDNPWEFLRFMTPYWDRLPAVVMSAIVNTLAAEVRAEPPHRGERDLEWWFHQCVARRLLLERLCRTLFEWYSEPSVGSVLAAAAGLSRFDSIDAALKGLNYEAVAREVKRAAPRYRRLLLKCGTPESRVADLMGALMHPPPQVVPMSEEELQAGEHLSKDERDESREWGVPLEHVMPGGTPWGTPRPGTSTAERWRRRCLELGDKVDDAGDSWKSWQQVLHEGDVERGEREDGARSEPHARAGEQQEGPTCPPDQSPEAQADSADEPGQRGVCETPSSLV